MAGIYIHIPYCKQACIYCDFHFSTGHKNKEALVGSLCKEIELRHDALKSETIDTIYFGGGTPSILSATELGQILNAVFQKFAVASDAEITLEANPDDLSAEKVHALKSLGINRLSIGIQSFFDDDLLWMRRAHNADQARNCIPLAQDAGITNISADLIFATPLLTAEKLAYNLKFLTDTGIPHISCYNLTVEEKTGLHFQVKKKQVTMASDEIASDQFYLIHYYLQQCGYEHYEISNYAIPGKFSKHNTSYWLGKKYLGIGPSAHSFDGRVRRWNISNNEIYIKNLNSQLSYSASEILTDANRFNETLLTGLRTIWGVSYAELKNAFPLQFSLASKAMDKLLAEGKLQLENDRLFINSQHWVLSDSIVAGLFII